MESLFCPSSVEYWNQRYLENSAPYDWYNEWPALKPHLPVELKESSHVLHIGCGTSRLGQALFDEGVRDVKNIDTSVSCIKAMKDLYPYLDYEVMDATEIGTLLPELSYDIVIDKGCMDTVLCSENFDVLVPKMLEGIHRVLRDSGVLMVVSVGCPANRMMYLETSGLWSVTVARIPKRHIELIDAGELSVNLSPCSPSDDLCEKYFDGASDGSHAASANEQADFSAFLDERRHHFIYICAKVG